MTGRSLLLASAFLATATCALAQQPSQLLYVSNEDSGTVSVIDMEAGKAIDQFEVGVRPRGIRLSPDGKILFVALSGSPKCGPNISEEECEKMAADKTKDGVAVIDVASRKLLRVLPGGSDPEQFDITPDGKRLYVANEDAGRVTVVEVETGRIVKEVKVGAEPEGVKIGPDGKLALVASEETSTITAIDTTTLESTCTLTVGKRPRDIVFASTASAFVSSEASGQVFQIDPVGCKNVRAFKPPAGARPMGLALSDDKTTLYVGNGRARTISAIEIASGTIRNSEPVGVRPWGVTLSPDGTRLFTANGPSNDVAVLDAKTLAVTGKIAVGKSPWGLAAPAR
jgi:YVTN family beta-propeller protein